MAAGGDAPVATAEEITFLGLPRARFFAGGGFECFLIVLGDKGLRGTKHRLRPGGVTSAFPSIPLVDSSGEADCWLPGGKGVFSMAGNGGGAAIDGPSMGPGLPVGRTEGVGDTRSE
jgi:hypothetical protein